MITKSGARGWEKIKKKKKIANEIRIIYSRIALLRNMAMTSLVDIVAFSAYYNTSDI